MADFKRIIVALDMTKLDDRLILFANSLVKEFSIDKVYFATIIPKFHKPEHINPKYLHLFKGNFYVEEHVRAQIVDKIHKYFDDTSGVRVEVVIRKGYHARKLLNLIDKEKVDLLIVGKKDVELGTGLRARRVARACNCSVFFLNCKKDTKWKKILVPVDFSEYSAKAMQHALRLKKIDPRVEIDCLHVLEFQKAQHFLDDFDYAQYIELLKTSSEESFAKFIKKYNLKKNAFNSIFAEADYSSTSEYILQYAKERKIDLVIMGAQGHSGLRNFFFGSISENFVAINDKTSTLVIR